MIIVSVPMGIGSPSGLGFYEQTEESIGVAVNGINVATFDENGLTISVASALALITAVANALPTTLPATSGVLWNNGGVLCLS